MALAEATTSLVVTAADVLVCWRTFAESAAECAEPRKYKIPKLAKPTATAEIAAILQCFCSTAARLRSEATVHAFSSRSRELTRAPSNLRESPNSIDSAPAPGGGIIVSIAVGLPATFRWVEDAR